MRLLPSKLSAPAPAKWLIERPRLLRRFSGGGSANLFLLVAPAGYGKTTLAVQALSTVPVSGRSWLHLDSRDTDPGRFTCYLVCAVARVIKGAPAESLLQFAETATPEAAVDELCYWLERVSGSPAWLVLDNWEVVNKEKPHRDIISRLVACSRGRLNTIVTSRALPAIGVRRKEEMGEAVVLGKDQLAFTVAEFSQAIRARSQTESDERLIEEAWKLTHGWCVTAGFIDQSAQRRPRAQGRNVLEMLASSKSLTEYVREELIHDVSLPLAEFLARCSVLDVISPESSSAVTAKMLAADHRKHLAELRESTIPYVTLKTRDSYRLHPLIRQAFNQVLRDNFSSEQLRQVYSSAAEFYRGQDAVIEAIELLLDLPDYRAALKTMNEDWRGVVAANGLGRVESWLARFPRDFHDTPGYIKIQAQLYSALGQNRHLVAYLRDRLDPEQYAGEYDTLANLWIHYNWAALHLSADTGYAAVRKSWRTLTQRCGTFGTPIQAGVQLILSLAAYQELRPDTAVKHAETCLAALDDSQFDYRMTVRSNIAVYRHLQGASSQAMDDFDTILAECRRREAFAIVPMVLVNAAEVHVSQARYSEALESIVEARRIMERHAIRNPGVSTHADRLEGVSRWYLGEKTEGLSLLTRSVDSAGEYDERERLSSALLRDFHASLESGAKLPVSASHESVTPRSEQNLIRLGATATLAAKGSDWVTLEQSAGQLAEISKATGLLPWRATACFLLSYRAHAAGDSRTCKLQLRQGLGLLDRAGRSGYPLATAFLSGYIAAKAARFQIMPAVIARMLTSEQPLDLGSALQTELLDPRISVAEIRRLLDFSAERGVRGLGAAVSRLSKKRSRSLVRDIRRYQDESDQTPLPALHVRTFGAFSVVTEGQPVVFRRNKSRLLLEILITKNLGPIHEEVIIEWLWPDSDPARSRGNLQTCVKELRKDLDPYHDPRGKSYIDYADRHYALVLPDQSTIDVLEFKRLAGTLSTRASTGESLSDQHERDLRYALSLYRGDYLPQERFESFVLESRERLSQIFLDVTLMLSRHMLSASRPREAVRILNQGIDYDPLWGDGVETLIQAHVDAGELFGAMRVYRNYETRIQAELGLPPDENLRRLFDRLMAGGSQDGL